MESQLRDRRDSKMQLEYLERLTGDLGGSGGAMLERFLTPPVVEAALDHSGELVRPLGKRFIREVADAAVIHSRRTSFCGEMSCRNHIRKKQKPLPGMNRAGVL